MLVENAIRLSINHLHELRMEEKKLSHRENVLFQREMNIMAGIAPFSIKLLLLSHHQMNSIIT